MANICHLRPIIRICSGIISRMVSRSSKIASTWILRYIQLFFRLNAASIVKRMPAEVGAAKRLSSRFSFHAAESVQRSEGSRTKI